MHARTWTIIAFLALAGVGLSAIAQNRDRGRDDETTEVSTKAAQGSRGAAGVRSSTALGALILTPSREAAALTFARLHHPELADLLEQLKKKSPAAYQRAVRQLYQTSERLTRIKERSPDRYEEALEDWMLESRNRLLAARAVMSGEKKLDAKLREGISRQLDRRLKRMKEERERLAERLEKLEAAINALESDREAAVQQQIERLQRSLGTRRLKARRRRSQKSGVRGQESEPAAQPDARSTTGTKDKGRRTRNP